jgi:hypothetical protein
MKTLIAILGMLNGGYMIADGIYVMAKGKYIGPEKPGPWADLFMSMGIDVFSLGPLFILFGIAWQVWVYGLLTNRRWAFSFGIMLCILTLWYLTVGTAVSVIILLVLIISRKKMFAGNWY